MAQSTLQRWGPTKPPIPYVAEARVEDMQMRSSHNGSPPEPSLPGVADSPSLELDMPSPTFDLPGIPNTSLARRIQEEQERLQSGQFPDFSPSPLLDTPASDSSGALHFGSAEGIPKQRTWSTGYRDGNDARSAGGRERGLNGLGSAPRNYSTTSLSTDRSGSEERATQKSAPAKRSRLNLLNPMSLLARRRSSQNAKADEPGVSVNAMPVLAVPDFDPSIRGNIVHDFSNPRVKPARPSVSSVGPGYIPRRGSDQAVTSPPSANSQASATRSPAFKEHFQGGADPIQPHQTGYLHQQALDAPRPDSLPAFAQKLPISLPFETQNEAQSPAQEKMHQRETFTQPPPPPPPPKHTPPPPPLPKNTPPLSEELPPVSLPKHTKSTSSRFSFQMGGGSVAEEKLLEEKHKEHSAKRRLNGLEDSEDPTDDGYDDYDINDEDEYEERIPGVNTDYGDEEDEFGVSDIPIRNIELQTSQSPALVPPQNLLPNSTAHVDQAPAPLEDFHFTPQVVPISPPMPDQASHPTPRDQEGFPIGIADSEDSQPHPGSTGPVYHSNATEPPRIFFEGLQISAPDDEYHQEAYSAPQNGFDDEELYYDDGEFSAEAFGGDDSAGAVHDQGHFDEALLDDSTHIRDIPAENAKRFQEALRQAASSDEVVAVDRYKSQISRDTSTSSGLAKISSQPSMHRDQSARLTGPKQGVTLTEGNLAAYHDALALAANKAHADGRFNRQVSFSESSDSHPDLSQHMTNTGLVADRGQPPTHVDDVVFPEDDDFSFDDDNDFDDDLMIAEANAEALENDDDGFYGQEFGFYARAHGKSNPELVNGGFFASRGSNGVKRSHSGRNNFQEPSLTPITERSEWSARNSVASLPVFGGFPPSSAHSLPSPGFGQLMDSPGFEDDMTLSALMKLRRNTFGSSSTSVNSTGERNPAASSPLSQVTHHGYKQAEGSGASKAPTMNAAGAAGSTSIMESEEEDEEISQSLTVTQNTPRKPTRETRPITPQEQMTGSATELPVTSRKSGHSRNSSGAESVSYVRDDSGRWMVEKRRAGDDGALEIIDREYLAGAQI